MTKWEEFKKLFQRGRSFGWYVRNFLNLIDDPVDKIKEKLHCHALPFGRQLNISFLMQNRKTTWDIIRRQGHYDNCDPEDLSEIPQ
jgi:hypothetical protein